MLHLGGHVHVCGDGDEEAQRAIAAALPEELRDDIASLMRAQDIHLFAVFDGALLVELSQTVETLDRMALAPTLRRLGELLGKLES